MRNLIPFLLTALIYTNTDVLQAVKDVPTNGRAEQKVEAPKTEAPTSKCSQEEGEGNAQFAHEETCLDVPRSYSKQLWQAEGWFGNDKYGYWPINQDGEIDPSKWRSSLTGVAA